MTTLSRRRLLALGAAGLAALVVGCPGDSAAIPPIAQRFAGGAEAIGERYLAARPQERRKLPGLIFDGPRWRKVTPDDVPAVAALLAEQIAEDFDQGRTVVLGGWVLSETEARVCGLLARG